VRRRIPVDAGHVWTIPRRAAFVLAAVTGLLAPASLAFANHDLTVFELDGNALRSASPGDDWTSLFPTRVGSTDIARLFVVDGTANPADTSYFTGGGSKDTSDVSEWRHTTGDVAPDKDELADAFAAAYISPADTGKNDVGDLVLYFGTDRYANNGDAQIGFWFFRNAIGLKNDGTFTGLHAKGDILILSDFTQGGRVGTVKVYRWVGSGGSAGQLDLITVGDDCNDGPGDDAVCSVENETAATAPWTFVPKSGSAGTFPTGTFYEGGINVTRLAGIRCFSSYMVETRSSQAVGAQLKDLILGPFDTCPSAPPSRPPSVHIASGPYLPLSGVYLAGPTALASVLILGGTVLVLLSVPPRKRENAT
jgi:hypothetical protein